MIIQLMVLILAFFWFVPLEGLAADSDDSEGTQPEPKRVVYLLLHNDQHEFLQAKKQEGEVKPSDKKEQKKVSSKSQTTKPMTPKKEWVVGTTKEHAFTTEHKATLSIKGLNPSDSIQFLFESTMFKSDEVKIGFVYEPAYFLNKIASLSPETTSKKYNHLCLTLFAVYKDGNKRKIAESPLYAKWKERVILSEDGKLKKDSTAKFYTVCDSSISGQLAYFMTGASGYHTKARKDNDVFPIQCSSCYDQQTCTAVCKEFGEESTVSCNDKSSCSHTEPNALFHVNKHKDKLFSPLIAKAGGVANVKNIGVRFFSFYQSCTSCVKLLNQNKKLSLTAKDFSNNINFLFYFQRTYQPNIHIVKLSGKVPLKRFTTLHNNGQLFIGSPIEVGRILAEWGDKYQILGCIELAKEIDLNIGNKILLVQPLPEEDVSKEDSSKIYVVI
ncbi:MAG: hypothetical protein FJX71_00960 [Alphaproteobacteria bacterium]|nr:hypothetical protein [Alphaproteobacteria bacterium]